MRNLFYYSFSLSLLCAFSACQKEATLGSTNQYLRKTTSRDGDSLNHTTYTYDSQNRLVSISRSFNQGQGEQYRINITYDAQGRMVSSNQTGNGIDSFQYDNQNRIVQKLHITPSSTTYPGRSTYSYDTKGRLIADTLHSYWANEIFEYTTYTYDQNDNVIEIQVFRNNAGVYYVERKVTLQFDTKTNPYYSLGSVLYFTSTDTNGIEYLLSKNNSIRKTFPNGDIISYNYIYTGALPVKATTTDSSDPGWISTDEFYY
jgi:YD repeat-containing protein